MDFTINLAPQFRAFSRDLLNEKLNAPLFPGPVGSGTTNGWCIVIRHQYLHEMTTQISISPKTEQTAEERKRNRTVKNVDSFNLVFSPKSLYRYFKGTRYTFNVGNSINIVLFPF